MSEMRTAPERDPQPQPAAPDRRPNPPARPNPPNLPALPILPILPSSIAALAARWWPAPATPPAGALGAAAAVGLLAAASLPQAPLPGVGITLCAVAAAVPVSLVAVRHGREEGRRWPVGRVPAALAAVALGLSAVSAVRASEWLAWGCAAAALCLAAAACLDVRRWAGLLATLPLFGLAVLRSLPWAARAVRLDGDLARYRPWVRGIGVGAVTTLAVGALLAGADEAFADLVGLLWPSWEVEQLPVRLVLFAAATATVLGGMFAVSTRLALPTRRAVRDRVTSPGGSAGSERAERHAAEWLTPLVLVAVTIAAFLAVEAGRLFGGADVVRAAASTTHADRAREGFGQLAVVTLIVLVLLTWAGRVSAGGPPSHRPLMGWAGGALLVLTLLLATSALRRLWLYQDAYGWTVTRLNGGAFELWIVAVLLGAAAGWALRRTDLLPRFVVGSAGLGLLLVGMAGPDALVARANVDRFARDGVIDTAYLSRLSADAVPALDRLPEPARSCALRDQRIAADPWSGWNLARSRADDLLRARPATPGPACTGL